MSNTLNKIVTNVKMATVIKKNSNSLEIIKYKSNITDKRTVEIQVAVLLNLVSIKFYSKSLLLLFEKKLPLKILP